ncbi:MAG TPA: hypothetical protein VFT74_05110 [Isosphaeraceae bacterium]|nr:hypothetical protein [Isosphaeraceae bacterium]
MGTAIIVLGGHRSGTSCVAGIIHRLGVPLGEHLLGPGVGNPVGHFEDLEFYHLHRLILGENRDPKAWRYPRPNLDAFRGPYKALVDLRNQTHPRWAVKDPRLCFTLPLLLESHPGEVRTVRVHRDPRKSAQSLAAREGDLSLQDAEAIAWSYHRAAQEAAELAIARGPALHLHFDYVIGNPRQAVEELARFLLVPPSEMNDRVQSAVKSINPSLNHWGPSE